MNKNLINKVFHYISIAFLIATAIIFIFSYTDYNPPKNLSGFIIFGYLLLTLLMIIVLAIYIIGNFKNLKFTKSSIKNFLINFIIAFVILIAVDFIFKKFSMPSSLIKEALISAIISLTIFK